MEILCLRVKVKLFNLFFIEDENLVFRGNSFATKAMDSYMKMIGESVSWCFNILIYLFRFKVIHMSFCTKFAVSTSKVERFRQFGFRAFSTVVKPNPEVITVSNH